MKREAVRADGDEPVSFGALMRYFLWLGTLGFGGPIATVGYMQRDLVDRRPWLPREDFLNGVALGQTMPGPLAAQVAMWVGFLRRGALGAFLVSIPFIMPSFVVVIGLGVVYERYQGLDLVQDIFYGVAPGVMAIIVIAAIKLARITNGADRRLWGITIVLGTVTALTGAEIALLVIGAGVMMILWDARPRWRARGDLASFAPMPLAAFLTDSGTGELGSIAWFFFKAGAFIFGSGLAIVPFLRAGVIEQYGWLTERQFLDAVAIGLITPGPVVISAAFIGYLVAGLIGAVVATVAIFLPIYLGVVIPGPWFVRHRDNAQVKAFVRGATAAAAGAIAGATVVLMRQAVVDAKTTGIVLASLLLLWRFKVKEPILVLLAALAGLGLR